MKVRQKVLLNDGKKKLTSFKIFPEIGEETKAHVKVGKAVLDYKTNRGIKCQEFFGKDDPFTILVLEDY